jgi:transcriptional regulator with XRE-family HTH domain
MRSELSISIGQRIRALREQRKLDQMTLAMRLGVFQSVLSNLEAGLHCPRAEMAIKLSQELDCTTDYLLLGDQPKSKPRAHRRLS